MSGAAKVEAPYVEDGVIKRWNVIYNPTREFAVDMAGFAVNLGLILNSTWVLLLISDRRFLFSASFGPQCKKRDPEDCFLRQLNMTKKNAQPFGWDSDPKDILVWHTKTVSKDTRGDDYGYVFEMKNAPPPIPVQLHRKSRQNGES